MHPEWCRNLVKYIVDAINNIEIEVISDYCSIDELNNSVQLILSTHSPYVLSDIVTDRNIFLERVSDKSVQKQQSRCTFAANPIELLKSDFYVDGYMGAYSNIIINRVIDLINGKKKDFSEEEYEMAKEVVSRIGEPILKDKLEESL